MLKLIFFKITSLPEKSKRMRTNDAFMRGELAWRVHDHYLRNQDKKIAYNIERISQSKVSRKNCLPLINYALSL